MFDTTFNDGIAKILEKHNNPDYTENKNDLSNYSQIIPSCRIFNEFQTKRYKSKATIMAGAAYRDGIYEALNNR